MFSGYNKKAYARSFLIFRKSLITPDGGVHRGLIIWYDRSAEESIILNTRYNHQSQGSANFGI